MGNRLSLLHLFRRERHPLVALAAMGLAVRLLLTVLAQALSPEAAVAAGLEVLCQPSHVENPVSSDRSADDPLTCNCASICPHGCSLPGLFPSAVNEIGDKRHSVKAVTQALPDLQHAEVNYALRPIRAPPSV